MGKTLRKFSKKGKKTQQRRKTKGKKYGGNDEDCNVGTGNISNVNANECTINDEPFNENHKRELIDCFNAQAEKAGEIKNLTKEQTNQLKINENSDKPTIIKKFKKMSVTLHPDKGGPEAAFKKLSSSYGGLTGCEFNKKTVMTNMYHDTSADSDEDDEPEPEPEPIKIQKDRQKIIAALMNNIYGDECNKKHPEPTGFFGTKLTDNNDPKVKKRSIDLADCNNANREKIANYLRSRKMQGRSEFPGKDEEIKLDDIIQGDFYVNNIKCAKDRDEKACKKTEEVTNKMGGKGKSKKSTRKTKKAKYSKRK